MDGNHGGGNYNKEDSTLKNVNATFTMISIL